MSAGAEDRKDVLILIEECERKLLELLKTPSGADVLDVGHASSLLQQLEGYVSDLVSVPSASPIVQIAVVKKVLRFCQRGEVADSAFFEALGTQLASLFKVTYRLLKSCLDAIVSEQCLAQFELSTLITEVTAVASLSLYFDPSLLALCWRGVGKLACSSASISKVVPHVVEELCGTIIAITKQSGGEGDLLLEKRLKSGRFLGSLLLRLLSHFPVVVEECGKVTVDMLLSTYQEVHVLESTIMRSKLESSILLVNEPLIQYLSNNLNFIKILLDHSNVVIGQHQGWALCLATLLKYFPSLPDIILRYCLEAVSSKEEASFTCRILDCIFTCLDHCHHELTVAGVCNGKLGCSVSLYESVCSHICSALTCISDDLFCHVEKNFIFHLFTSHTLSCQLALDCLTFIARLGGDTVVSTYCNFVIELLERVPVGNSHAYPVLMFGSWLNRLVVLLPSPLQINLFSAHASHTSALWLHLQPHSLHSDTVQAMGLVSDAANLVSKVCTGLPFDRVGPSLYCLCALYQQENTFVEDGDVKVNAMSEGLLQSLHSPSPYCHELSLYLLSQFLPVLPQASITKVLSHLSDLASAHQSFSLTLALCHVLGQLASLHFYDKVQEASISQCYFSLLSVPHWLVRHHVLESFRAFAEVTPHANAVQLCVPVTLTNTVIEFLHKIPCKHEVYQAKCVELIQPIQQLLTLNLPNTESDIIKEFKKSWENIQNLKELSTEILSQLATINTRISSFLAKFMT